MLTYNVLTRATLVVLENVKSDGIRHWQETDATLVVYQQTPPVVANQTQRHGKERATVRKRGIHTEKQVDSVLLAN